MKNKFKTFIGTKTGKASAVSVGVLLLLILFYTLIVHSNGIAKGISVNGTDIGGKSVAEAEAVLSASIPDISAITVKTETGEAIEIPAADISLSYNAKATAEAAYAYSRRGNIFGNIVSSVRLFFSHADLPFECDADIDAVDRILYEFGVLQNGELKEYVFEFGDGFVNVSPGISGQDSDVSSARGELLNAVSRGIFDVTVSLKKTEPPEPTADSLYDRLYTAPVDASYEITDGKVVIHAEQYGMQIDKIEAGTLIDKLKNGETVTLKTISLAPQITLETLHRQLFNHVLGEYTTRYTVSNKNRSKNVELAASKINGVILAPGEDFSYNETVGERSKANGFLDAPIYENGETVLGTGGGVCQVSSTLYSAALYADLEIVTRRCHSLTVSYVPKGQDATVAYGSIDFQFKNNTEYPVKISASAYNGKLTVSLYGTAPEKDKKVTVTNTVLDTQNPETEEVADRTLPTGSKKVLSAGKTGYTVETIRTVYEDGVAVKTENMGRSVYKSVPSKIAVGSAVPTPMPTLEPRVTPEPEITEEAEAD